MEKTNKQLAREIRAMREPERHLPELMNRMASAYGMLSLYNTGMELSVLSESEEEGRIRPDKKICEWKESIYRILRETLLAPFSTEAYEKAVLEIKEIREEIISRMEILTAYTDLFVLYEYVMNRLEAVFEPEGTETMENDAVAREILQWIFSDKDAAMTNTKIRAMLSCLPIRMTKAKFLELVSNAFSIYEKTDGEAIDTFDYMLRSAAGLYTPEGMEKTYPELERIRKLFEEKSLSELTAEEYNERKEALKRGTDDILNETESLSSLQTTANALLTALLMRPYFTLQAERESSRPLEILARILDGEVRAEVLFEGIETEMEQITQELATLDPLLICVQETLEPQIQELMLATVYQKILVAQKLNSGSVYVSLEEKEAEEHPRDYVKKVKEAFLADAAKALEQGSRVRNRAVMAEVLKELPVYFNNHTEVMNYVRNSLDSCKDEQEKRICVELLHSFYE